MVSEAGHKRLHAECDARASLGAQVDDGSARLLRPCAELRYKRRGACAICRTSVSVGEVEKWRDEGLEDKGSWDSLVRHTTGISEYGSPGRTLSSAWAISSTTDSMTGS